MTKEEAINHIRWGIIENNYPLPKELGIEACEMAIEALSKPIKINLNDTIKVKLTDYGKQIYYHQFDKLNDWVKSKGCKLIEPKMPEVDEEGKTRFQLWSFMEMYGNYIGLTKPNFIEPLEIEIEEE